MLSPPAAIETSPILCLQHCKKGSNITCLAIPEKCPLCGQQLKDTPQELPPFRLPSPFMSAINTPYSIVIKPTKGNFLLDYTDKSDLHVGITDSRGTAYSYDQFGVTVSSQLWVQCVPITLMHENDLELKFDWDIKLQECAMRAEWTAARYDEDSHNCFDFTLFVLKYLGLGKNFPTERLAFCETVVAPKATQAAKYISLYRLLLKQGLHITSVNNNV